MRCCGRRAARAARPAAGAAARRRPLLTELQRPGRPDWPLQARIGPLADAHGRAGRGVLDGGGRASSPRVELDSEGNDFIRLLLWGSGAGLLACC